MDRKTRCAISQARSPRAQTWTILNEESDVNTQDQRLTNVFVFGAGRCRTTTFAKACSYITNYSSAYEIQRLGAVSAPRVQYPAHHIVVDPILVCWLGELQKKYGDRAYYVYLCRDVETAADSHLRRRTKILAAWHRGLLYRDGPPDLGSATDYVRTVCDNIAHFLQSKSHKQNLTRRSLRSNPPIANSDGSGRRFTRREICSAP